MLFKNIKVLSVVPINNNELYPSGYQSTIYFEGEHVGGNISGSFLVDGNMDGVNPVQLQTEVVKYFGATYSVSSVQLNKIKSALNLTPLTKDVAYRIVYGDTTFNAELYRSLLPQFNLVTQWRVGDVFLSKQKNGKYGIYYIKKVPTTNFGGKLPIIDDYPDLFGFLG